ncbi:thermonuclease family protein [Alteriqipengyuania flavescens]|uniref:thermonuclease family protein n=1 Tax=Alteriqipengyuania flavescens TaxID=3053610 RepID=UPI0025B3CDDC|nr:thermonuclease family protein [Alteriqipengyuania flavescens]WJY18096.1 thermonuclease family protein [Alteriqipengyuania flavescens]WJY24037.1 thermonuclease family protein [Alteriqipengyuania flavescens]
MSKRAVLIAFASLAFWLPSGASAQQIVGMPTVIDGDSLEFAGTGVRLLGIDAPEAKQTCMRDGEVWACGLEAAAFLGEFVKGRMVNCETLDVDQHGRFLSQCRLGDLDLALVMVEQGLAVAADDAPAEYLAAQALRQEHRIGIWGSDFEMPKAWCEANPDLVPAPAPAPVAEAPQPRAGGTPAARDLTRRYTNRFGCAIKGNRSRRGEWIYHLPGQEYYDVTHPEELFCTEAEAIRAGYRRTKN